MTATSLVIVAYRSSAHLADGLPVVLRDPSVGDIVVVDNSSDPATAAVVARFGNRVRYLDPRENLGFARACNLGLQQTVDPVVTFLNPDVLLVRPLTDLVRTCAEGGPMILGGGLTEDATDGVLGNVHHRVTWARELGRAVLGSRVSAAPMDVGVATSPVDQVDGALLMGRRDFLEALGGFDERFELYFEDVDLCERARARGAVLLDTRRYGTHAGGASAKTAVAASYCVFRISRIRYFAKRSGWPGALGALALTVVEALARTVTRQPEGGRARRRALLLALREVARPGSVRVLAPSVVVREAVAEVLPLVRRGAEDS
jgi:GT2 family glycosyltransferase